MDFDLRGRQARRVLPHHDDVSGVLRKSYVRRTSMPLRWSGESDTARSGPQRWREQMIKQFGLVLTIRRAGRPRKHNT